MREEIIRRNTITTIIVLVLFFILSIFINARSVRNNVQASIIASSNVLITRMNNLPNDATTEDYIDICKEYSTSDWLMVVLADSEGGYLYDSTNDIDYQFYNMKLDESDILLGKSVSTDKKKIYVKDNKMSFLNKLDNGMLIKTSLVTSNDFTYILYNAFYLLILIAIVLIIEIIASRKINLMFSESFGSITKNLKSISEGNYELFDVNSKYSEVREALTDIDSINRSIYQYVKNISIERDKVEFIVNNLHQGIFILDLNKKVLLVNEYAMSRLEISSLFESGEDVFFNQIFDKDEINDAIDQIISDPSITTINDLSYYFHDAKRDRIYQVRMSYIDGKWTDKSDNGLIFIFLINVTKEKKDEESKVEFIANVSHELKTPITSINGFSELLLSGLGSTDDVAKDYLKKIYNESEYMKKTIEELLYLSNLDFESTSKIDLEEIIDLDDLVKESVNYYFKKAQEANILLEYVVFPVCIKGSWSLITHLVNNLIENAIKYNKPKGSINVCLVDEDPFVYLEVKDTGIGIDKKNFDNLFERFYRVEKSRSRKTGGVGLGLSICQRICDIHHTHIEVESKVGVGSTFKVKFLKEK